MKCPWKGLPTKVVSENYSWRLKEMKMCARNPSDPSEAMADPSGKGIDEFACAT
jgi:hypothetical protein